MVRSRGGDGGRIQEGCHGYSMTIGRGWVHKRIQDLPKGVLGRI